MVTFEAHSLQHTLDHQRNDNGDGDDDACVAYDGAYFEFEILSLQWREVLIGQP